MKYSMANKIHCFRIEKANKADESFLFCSRNIESIVALGASGRTVSWEEHVRWFDSILQSSSVVLYVVFHEMERIGQVRFDSVTEHTARISIYLIPDYIDKGLGSKVIKESCVLLRAERPDISSIEAEIRSSNVRSIKSFERAGFQRLSEKFNQNDDQSQIVVLRSVP